MLYELGIGHTRVLRALAADDTGLQWGLELATQLPEKLRRSDEHEAREISCLALLLELADQKARKVVLPPVLVGIATVSVLSAVLAVELAIEPPRLIGIHGLKQSSVTAVGDENPGLCHGLP